MSRTGRRVSQRFLALPETVGASEPQRKLVASLNRSLRDAVETVEQAVRLRTAPDESGQAVGQMRAHLRAAAQHALAAIGFAEQAREAGEPAHDDDA